MPTSESSTRIGIISDTHGLLRAEAINALMGVERIIHAGDIDTLEVMTQLEKIAPLSAVRGNMDQGIWANALPSADIVRVKQVRIYVLHDLERFDLDPQTAHIDVVVSGHTHQPHLEHRDGVLYFNPGSPGYPRHGRLPSLGILTLKNHQASSEIIQLSG